MAKYEDGIDHNFVAETDLDDYQYHFVRSSGSTSGSVSYVNVGNGASNPGPLGVLQNDPNTGQEAQVRMFGSTQLVVNGAGSTIYFGRFLTAGSDGHGEPIDYSAASVAHAIALDHCTGDGVTIEAWVQLYLGHGTDAGS